MSEADNTCTYQDLDYSTLRCQVNNIIYIVLEKIMTFTLLHGTKFDIALGNNALFV